MNSAPLDIEKLMASIKEDHKIDMSKLQDFLDRNPHLLPYDWFHLVKSCLSNNFKAEETNSQLLQKFASYGNDDMKVRNINYALRHYDRGEKSSSNSEPDMVTPSEASIQITKCMSGNDLGLLTHTAGSADSILWNAVKFGAHWLIPSNIDKSQDNSEKIKSALKEDTPDCQILDVAVESGADMTKKIMTWLNTVEVGPPSHGTALFHAIRAKDINTVRLLLEFYPDMVKYEDKENNSALQILKDMLPFKGKEEIERELVSKILHQGSPAIVRRLLRPKACAGKYKQVHLDLSDFNDDKLSFSTFVENVKNGKLEIDFYNTLIYIEFPDLQASALNSKRDEAITILEWLNEKGVHNILSLNVPDSLQNPHRESDIVKTLQKFESVEFLNWRIQDMSLDTLKRIKGLKSLRLYSSGNRDVLKFWTSDEGLVNLEIGDVEICVMANQTSAPDEQQELIKDTEERLKKRMAKRKFTYCVAKASPQDVTSLAAISAWHPGLFAQPADVATGLEPFLHTFRTLSAGKFARVAIIDTGVDINLEEISSCVERGETFIDYKSDRESHWWVASEPHGTHMATIIRKLNPKCKLFIAKVGTSRDDIRIESLSRAIEWAREQNVDIINLSMTVRRSDDKFEDETKRAANEDIVFFCSTEDVGASGHAVYPAFWPEWTLAISGTDSGGKEVKYTDRNARYFFPGENIHTKGLSYRSPSESVSGSSVATAIASGVASLILSCGKWANKGVSKRRRFVSKVFDAMRAANDKYVYPGRLFSYTHDSTKGKWGEYQWTKFIEDRFGPNGPYA